MKLLFSIAIAAAAAGGAQVWDWSTADDELSSGSGFASSKAICRQVRHREPPAEDAPSAAEAAALKGCSSEALYYGIGVKADPVKARQCALLELREKRDDSVFSGRTMLMTIYANGVGARRDLDLATHFACGIEGAPMESHGRVSHLSELKAEGWTGRDFHFCDDITSGYAGGFCAAHAFTRDGAGIVAADRLRGQELAIAGVERRVGRAMVRRPEPRRPPRFQRLHHLEQFVPQCLFGIDHHRAAQGAAQVDLARAMRFGEGGMGLAQAFEGLPLGRLPPRDDRGQLGLPFAALDPGLVRGAQRAWLRYRDAFLAFAALRYPQLGRDGLAAWLTRNRTKMWEAEEN